MQLIVAEKRTVADAIANVVGASVKHSGYILGPGRIITWCVGHLVELAPAHKYDPRYLKWKWDDLPIVPETWEYCVSEKSKQQFMTIRRLMLDPTVDEIVCATDAGREGELIFRLVYNMAGCTKPVKRLWTSSLEESAICSGLLNLMDGSDFDTLYQAALCRAQADWLVGINASRLYSLMYGPTLNVGRVVSPTLAMIVSREAAIRAFQSEPFYTVQLSCGFLVQSERIKSKEEAEAIYQKCNLKSAVVKSVTKVKKTEKPPKLYDLTTLQRDANRMFGYTAQQTLEYMQTLYEQKLLTYPRTDSQYLTSDMEDMLPELVEEVEEAFPYTAGLNLPINTGQVIDDEKVSDHHAIIPTRSMLKADLKSLATGVRDIVQLVAVRLLCAVGDAHVYEETCVELECEGVRFTGKAKVITQMGWKIPEATYQGSLGSRYKREKSETEYPIPEVKVGETLGPVVAKLKEGKTTPPKHYTEDTLLAAMEHAGAEEAPEDAERKGIGTPATRAGILEKLVSSGFVERKGDKRTKHLVPTDKGVALITVLPEQLQSPLLTAEWEHRLKRIEHGEEMPDDFIRDITDMVRELHHDAKPVPGAQTLFPPRKDEVGVCPHCGMAVYETNDRFMCGNRGCAFCIWKDNKFLNGKHIQPTAKLVKALLKDRSVLIKGLRSQKTGKTYDATLLLECKEDGSARFRFSFDTQKNGGAAYG